MPILEKIGLKKAQKQPLPDYGERAPMRELVAFGKLFQKIFQNPDKVLRDESKGENYDLYLNLIRRDSYLAALLHTRFHTAASLDWTINAHDDDDAAAAEQAEFVSLQFGRLKNLNDILRKLLYGVYFGFSVSEILWQPEVDGSVGIRTIKNRHQNRFQFDVDGNLLLKQNIYDYEGDPVPPNKFLLLQHNTLGENPYGMALAQPLYWLNLFKFFALRWGNVTLQRFGMPIIHAMLKGNPTQELITDLKNQLDSLMDGSKLVLNEAIEVDLLETKGTAKESPHWHAASFFEKEMAVAILGQTLTTGEGERSGSLALGRVHGEVRDDILQADARLLMYVIDEQLIKPLIDFNFVPNAIVDYPSFVLHYEPPTDLESRARQVEILVKVGMPITERQIRDEFTIDEPEGDEPTLSPRGNPPPPAIPTEESPEGEEEEESEEEQPSGGKRPVSESIATNKGTTAALTFKQEVKREWVKPSDDYDQYRLQGVLKMEEKLKKDLNRIYGNLAETLAHEFVNADKPEAILDVIDDIVVEKFQKELAEPMTAAVEETIRQAAREIGQQLNMAFSRKLFNRLVTNYAKTRAYNKGALKEITKTLRELLSSRISDIVAAGGSFDEMAVAIKAAVGDISDAKALQIAISETQMAANHAVLEMGKRSPLKLEAWFVGDTEACDICYEWSGRNPWTLKAAQSALYPHPGCRCQWILSSKKGG